MITTLGATEQADQPPVEAPAQAGLDEDKLAALTRLVQNRDKLDPETRATVEALAGQYKIPVPPKQGFSQSPNPRREQMSDLGEAARVSALPMGGQLVGGIAGFALGGPAGEMIGQSVGGVAGLAANKILGVSRPDELDVALSGAAPVAGKLLTMGGRKLIPGHAAAEQQIGTELLKEVPKLLPGDAASTKAAYDKVASMGSPSLAVPNFSKAIDDLAATESTAKKYGGAAPAIARGVGSAQKTIQTQGGTMPFSDAAVMLKRYREKIAGLEEKGGESYGAYKQLRKSLFMDMDAAEKNAATAGQNVTALREAMSAAKQSIAKEEFTDLLDKYGSRMVTVQGQTFPVIEPTKLLNKLNAIDFKASVGPQAYGKIESTLKELAKIPKPEIGGGAGIGTSKRVLAMGGAAAAGAALGGPIGAAGSSIAAAGAIAAHDAAASLMMSDRGREFLVKLFKANNGKLGERTAQMLQFAAAQLQDTGD